LNKGTKAEFSFPNTYNTAILVIEGSVKVNGQQNLSGDTFAMFENDAAETFYLEASDEKSIVLVISGEPLNEPIFHYGPFVMNSEEQIIKAVEEFQSGNFG